MVGSPLSDAGFVGDPRAARSNRCASDAVSSVDLERAAASDHDDVITNWITQ